MKKDQMSIPLYLRGGLLSVFVLVFAVVFTLTQRVVTDPYMDEIFHVQQTITYCDGHYNEWNAKITTFPGLYILTSTICRLLHLPCTTFVLRGINTFLVGGVGTLVSTYLLLRQLHPSASPLNVLLRWLRVVLHPTLFFFHFLFYTDSLALVSVLLLYHVALTSPRPSVKSFILELCLASLTIGTRQTHVVWVLGIACFKLKSYLPELYYNHSRVEKRQLFKSLVISILPHCTTCLSFLVFVIFYNHGQITLGHQEHHVLSRHYAQLVYLVTILFFSSFPNLPFFVMKHQSSKAPVRSPSKNLFFIPVVFTFSFLILRICMTQGWIVHPFILSDNRHFTFYIYRRFLSKEVHRQLVLPFVASIGVTSLFSSCTYSLSLVADLFIYFLCCAVTLVPAPLVEPRYFHVPCALFLLHLPIDGLTFMNVSKGRAEAHRNTLANRVPRQTEQQTPLDEGSAVATFPDVPYSYYREIFGISIYVFINCCVFYGFLFKPFPSFSHENGVPELGRFMY